PQPVQPRRSARHRHAGPSEACPARVARSGAGALRQRPLGARHRADRSLRSALWGALSRSTQRAATDTAAGRGLAGARPPGPVEPEPEVEVTLGGRADVARTLYLDVVNSAPTASGPPVSVGPPAGGGTLPPPGGGTPPPGGGTPPTGGGSGPIDPTRRESTEWVHAFSPRAGLVFQPTPLVALYASYSRSFNPLQLIHYINLVNIKPFRARQYEGGVKLDLLDARVQATAAVFGLEAIGYVLPTAQFGTVSYDGYKRSSGVEAETTAHAGPLTLLASYTFTDGDKRVGFPGQSLMNAARHSGSTWATWSTRTGRLQGLTLGAGV